MLEARRARGKTPGVEEELMNHTVGIWIDHKRAVIVSVSAGHALTRLSATRARGAGSS